MRKNPRIRDVSRKEVKSKYQGRKFVFAETLARYKTVLPKLGKEITGGACLTILSLH